MRAISALVPARPCRTLPQFKKQDPPVPNDLSDVRYQVALANRMLANEGVLDAFGHVSMRHPHDPGRYLLSRSRSPGLIEADDILEFTLDSAPVAQPAVQLYAERVIHGCIYQARPDVTAVVHHHAPAVMPFCIAGIPIVPVFHVGAAGGETQPFWNQRDEFGDTNLLVVKPEEGRSLARALGAHAAVLMNHHGATVVGRDLRELVSRAIFMCQNAEYQLRAQMLGAYAPGKMPTLTSGETKLAGVINAMPNVTNRTWEYWTLRLAKAGGTPGRGAVEAKATKGKPARARRRAASAKPATSRRTAARHSKRQKTGRSR
jgi:ribulose-5-phosphate 4-epimerase/fuculose-1-phosphate aldolase